MTKEQNFARNEAYQLMTIAQRILGQAGLTAYAEQVASVRAGMEMDNRMLVEQERNKRLGGA